MPFSNVNFIKVNRLFDPKTPGFAPLFRRKFNITENIKSATVHVCGLGYANYFLNDTPVTEDMFIAPVSDYRKTLWYNSYDVTDKLKKGENIFAVQCGNGWYNENMKTSWNFDVAHWRDYPKFILSLEVNGKRVLSSDEKWKCSEKSAIIYNQLRSGEYFDARLYDKSWTSADFDDSDWEHAVSDNTPPVGVFRPCLCEPIRPDREYPAVSMTKMGEDRYIFDFGQNMSGFIRLTVDQAEGDEVIIQYAEELGKDGELSFAHIAHHYNGHPVQQDRLICPKGKFSWTPTFTYHGFRYVEISGIKNPSLASATGIFVHQAVDARSSFNCSDQTLNELFRIGQMATWSNLFYMPTDCPTREKLGWCNDAQSSAEQFLTDFKTERLLAKWLQDIYDAMLPDGQLPGIIPSSGWGYYWGNGPVSDGVLFEIPYRLYLHTGNSSYLVNSLPYFERYLAFLETRENENGDVLFGLDDWAHPHHNEISEDNSFVQTGAYYINSALRVKFLQIALLAAKLGGSDTALLTEKLKKQTALHMKKFLNADGTCKIDKQTAVSMLICLDIYDELEPLKAQLTQLVKKINFHHDCGMLGLPYLFDALNKCGLQEYAFRILTSEGFPSFSDWIKDGATTLFEMWNEEYSKNHHMYSCFMAWMMKSIIGIRYTSPAYDSVVIEPCFFDGLDFASGHIDTPHGRISVDWKKESDGVHVSISIPKGISAQYNGKALNAGTYSCVK